MPLKIRVHFYPLGLEEIATCSCFVAMHVISYQTYQKTYSYF